MSSRLVNRVVRGSVMSALLALSVLVSPTPADANSVVNLACTTVGDHCYAVISQGVGSDMWSQTLSNLSSGTATVTTACQRTSDDFSTFVDNEIWLRTAPHPNGPAYLSTYWNPEWIEYGATTGVINGTYHGLSFFWARQYWSPTYGAYLYNEYVASGTPSLNVGYAVTIRWQTAGYWQILRGGVSQYTGIQSQQPPGNHEAVQAGAEMTDPWEYEVGSVSSLSRVAGGVTYNSWTGYVFQDTDVFTVSQSSSHLNFSTPVC